MNKFSKAADKVKLIRLVHVAKRDLALADDSYRAIIRQYTQGRTASSADCSVAELDAVIAHLKQCGFKVRGKAASSPARALAQEPVDQKIRALWLFLHELGEVRDPSEKALAGYVKRMTRVDALQWLNAEQTTLMIEALKKWAVRVLPALIRERAEMARQYPLPVHERAELNAQLQRAFERMSFEPMHATWSLLSDMLARTEAR
ncbi:gp16 family protein [Chitinimonas sp.]|uniref:gp16 family protein n=1 Tax=Chitinimonas sp. TaxID=1934313 RepID=UPI0035AE2C82